MTVYCVECVEHMAELIELDRKNLKLLRINLSPDMTFIFDHGYGEYTSWFLDGDLVSQYGVETSAMRPQGKNPHDDFNSVAKSVHMAQYKTRRKSKIGQKSHSLPKHNQKNVPPDN